MTKSRLIAIAAGTLLILGAFGAGSWAVWRLVQMREGWRLNTQGYDAGFRGDQDTAIQRFTAALQKPLSEDQRAYAYLCRGLAYNSKTKYDEAIRDFSEALRHNRKATEAYSGRAFAHQQRGELDQALADLEETIRLDPNFAPAYYNRALIFYGRRDFDRALPDCDEAVRCNPTSADPLILRGLCHIGKEQLDRALADFDGAVAVDPTSANAYAQRSSLYSRLGKLEKATSDADQAGRLKPASSANPTVAEYELLILQQKVASDEGAYDRVIELADKALALNLAPARASPALMNRGNAYAAKGDLNRALVDYDHAIRLEPRNWGAYVDRALALRRKGKREEAMNDYNTAIRIDPNQWQGYFDRAADYLEQDKVKQALDDLNQVIRLNRTYANGYVHRAAVYIRLGQWNKAQQDCESAIQINPNIAGAYVTRAKAYAQLGKKSQAIADLDAISKLDSKDKAFALNTVAWCRATSLQKQLRDGKKAVDEATQACVLTNWKNWTYIDTLAAAYAEEGRFDEAAKYQKQALEMANDSRREDLRTRVALYEHHKPFRE